MEATGDKQFPWTGGYRTGPRVGTEGGVVEVETRSKSGLSGTFHCEGSREVATREDVGVKRRCLLFVVLLHLLC